MRMFKSVDEKLADIGFEKIADNEYCVAYKREDHECNFTQRLDIIHKSNGRHLVQSYDVDLYDADNIGNVCVGLTAREMKLAMKKMRQKGWC